tara:strand:- start:251 stop:1621 length:1371 start_codon:yes stop_codon:yes gene_type:complete
MDLSKLITKQRSFFNSKKSRNLDFRINQLKKLQSIFKKYESDCFDALNKDLGKSSSEAYLTEMIHIRDELKLAIKNTKKWSAVKRVPTPILLSLASSYRKPEPYGIVLIVCPWNYPIALTLIPLIGAISAGNTVILKPSELAPESSRVITRIISESFSSDFIASIEGGVDTGVGLLEHRFDYIFFTGGTRVGQIYYESAAKNLTPVTLELGGKSPCIVDQEINIHKAAKRIVFGKYLNCGQSCTAPDYILVHRSIKEKFIAALIESIEAMYSKNPAENSDYPRIINNHHFDRVLSLIDKENIIFGGQYDKKKLFIAPTLLELKSLDDDIMNEEIFGPLLPIFGYENFRQVEDIVASKDKPLALYIFSNNKKLSNYVLNNFSFGGACVNDTMTHYANPNLPFGGVGQSGIGNYHGKFSFDTFSHYKSIFKKSMFIDFSALIRFAPWKEKFNFIKKIV